MSNPNPSENPSVANPLLLMDADDSTQFTPSLLIDSVDDRVDSPGRQLRYARERRGLTLEQVAAELRLRVATVIALENDDYRDLPSAVFISGYLSNYARLLGLAPAPLLARYRGSCPVETIAVRGPALPPTTVRSQHVLMRVMTVAVIGTLVGGVTLWWLNQQPVELPVPLSPLVEPAPLPVRPSVVPPSPVVPPTSAPAPVPSPAPHRREQGDTGESLLAAVTPAAAATVPPAVIPPAAPVPVPAEIALQFTAPCWVDIRDSSGQFKLMGKMTKGERQVLNGAPPYSVVLGNAAAVEIRVNGQLFDVTALARGGVARFDLDPGR